MELIMLHRFTLLTILLSLTSGFAVASQQGGKQPDKQANKQSDDQGAEQKISLEQARQNKLSLDAILRDLPASTQCYIPPKESDSIVPSKPSTFAVNTGNLNTTQSTMQFKLNITPSLPLIE